MFLYHMFKSTGVIELHNRTYAEEYIYISYPYLNAFLSSILKLHCSVYVCMHIAAALQYPRNKYGEFCPKYVNAKAIEKLNLLFKALGSRAKQIFALPIFNNSYLINYIQKENHLTWLLLSAFRRCWGWSL